MAAFIGGLTEDLISAVSAEWAVRERPFQADRYQGSGVADAVHYVEDSDILLSAPHALNHFRHGNRKRADRWTGGLCTLLADRLTAGSLTPIGPIGDWRVWAERRDAFRDALDSAVRHGAFVVDLHGMTDLHGVDVCIGLGPRPTHRSVLLQETLTRALAPLRVSSNVPFNAQAEYTVTAYVQETLKSDAIQIEIAARLRDPVRAPSMAAHLVVALEEGLRAFKADDKGADGFSGGAGRS